MSKYRTFVFKDYAFDQATKTLSLHYGYDAELSFTETYTFDFDFAENINQQLLDRTFQNLFFLAGVSYYKAYVAPVITIQKGEITTALAEFLNKTYQKGLGEFFYVNNLDPGIPINFPVNSHEFAEPITTDNTGLLIGLGGGKDSLVSVELLKNQPKVATWSVGHKAQLQPLVERVGLPHFFVERQWDTKLLELSKQDAFNGHVPISAIFAAVGSVVAVLTGYSDVVVSNENSANEPTLIYQGEPINHQYSKSLEFEKDYQIVLLSITPNLRYYSFLRPLSELHIAKLFASLGFEKYQDVFSSCNRAFTHGSNEMLWCGTCPKCAFVFLALTPFIDQQKLEVLFGGKNLLLDKSLEQTYRNLLGIEGEKPLECVGEIQECRVAMTLAKRIYPELGLYVFDLDESYDYLSLEKHSMPTDKFEILQKSVKN